MGDETRQGLQGGAQCIQAAFKGSQAGLKLLVLGVQLGHEVVHDILGLSETGRVGERRGHVREREGWLQRDGRPAPVGWGPTNWTQVRSNCERTPNPTEGILLGPREWWENRRGERRHRS